MYNATKIKTYTPILPDGRGGTGVKPEEAVYDIVISLDEENNDAQLGKHQDIDMFVSGFVAILGLKDWVDGEYVIFDDYKVKIETMSAEKFNGLPEFGGY